MSNQPKFSVITVCLNEEAGLGATCESVVGQRFKDFEWIVIDGGSTDGTLEILKEYGDSLTHLVSESDGGIYDAMNKGVAKASGEYLVFMNGGDCFASAEVLDRVAAAPRCDLIYGDLYYDEVGDRRVTFPDQFKHGYLLKQMAPHQATFYQRSLFERFGGYDTSFRIAGDYDLFVRLLEKGKVSHHHISEPLAVFVLGGVSGSDRHRALRKRENHQVRMKYFHSYRWSLKAWRETIRCWFRSIFSSS